MKSVSAIAAGGVIALGGMTACTVPPHSAALPCKASPSPVHPVQNATETIGIQTTPGAVALAVAKYKTTSTPAIGIAAASGRASVVFHIGRATIGFPVKVIVLVVKGRQSGVCSTSFTPVSAVGKAPAPKPKPKPIVPPKPVPVGGVHPPVSASVHCTDVNLPALPGNGDPFPAHSINITATGTDCLVARELATDARYAGPHGGGFPVDQRGFECLPTYGSDGYDYSCKTPASTATVTFKLTGMPETNCAEPFPGPNSQIHNVTGYNADCSFATDVAKQDSDVSPGNGFSADGFTCALPGWVQPTSAVLEYDCYTPDKLSEIVFQRVN